MGKKKDKTTESKKTNDKKTESKKTNDKADKTSKGGSFLDSLRPTPAKPENTRGTGKTKIENNPGLTDKTKKVVAGGIVAVAISALALVGLNMSGGSDEAPVTTTAPAAVVVEQQPIRAINEAAAASILPQPLAPQKDRLAEAAKKPSELTKPGKTTSKKSIQLASKSKSKESVKKSVAATKKQKAVKPDKKTKKTLAAKSLD